MDLELKPVKVPMVLLNGKKFYPEEVANIINALDKCDNRLKTVQISNPELKQELKNENIINFNSSGGAYPGENFNDFKTQMICLLEKKNLH